MSEVRQISHKRIRIINIIFKFSVYVNDERKNDHVGSPCDVHVEATVTAKTENGVNLNSNLHLYV